MSGHSNTKMIDEVYRQLDTDKDLSILSETLQSKSIQKQSNSITKQTESNTNNSVDINEFNDLTSLVLNGGLTKDMIKQIKEIHSDKKAKGIIIARGNR